jgi:hypothetical protein
MKASELSPRISPMSPQQRAYNQTMNVIPNEVRNLWNPPKRSLRFLAGSE